MNVWITGARGFIGQHVARALSEAGHSVHGIGHGAIDDGERARLGLRSWLNGEIEAANLDALASMGDKPAALVHLAGGSSVGVSLAQPLEDFSRTVCSTARLLEWLRAAAPECRLIVASSAAVYGSDHPGPIREDALSSPMSPYGQHKRMMEQLCQSYALSYGLRSTVVRLFSVYGEHLRKQLLWDICRRLGQGEPGLTLGGTGDEIRDWINVRDVARLFVTLIGAPQHGPFLVLNGGTGRGTSVAEIARLVTQVWKGDAIHFSGVSRAGDPHSLLADVSILEALPFTPRVAVAEGIAQYVAWARKQACE